MVRLEIREDAILMEERSAEGEVTVKAVSTRDFVRAVAGELVLDTGWLGPNVRRLQEKGGQTHVLIEDPPTVREVQYESRRFTIPTPRCLFAFVLRERNVTEARLVACGVGSPFAWIPTDRMMVQKFPFSNVFDDTRICWGHGQKLPKVTIAEVAGLVRLFWEIPFNHDLDGHGQVSRLWRDEYTEGTLWLFQKLQKLEVFPEDLLMSYGTLRSWFK
jgi:hypothetical protein